MIVTHTAVHWDPIDQVKALSAISGKWKVHIICHLLNGTKRFSDLGRLLPGIGRGMLSYELKQLLTDGIVARTQHLTIPPTVEYTLTSKGIALKPLLIELQRWGSMSQPSN
jgi:DNA-binding HxlR family transcriptional regulator